jgi:hypothetical protein
LLCLAGAGLLGGGILAEVLDNRDDRDDYRDDRDDYRDDRDDYRDDYCDGNDNRGYGDLQHYFIVLPFYSRLSFYTDDYGRDDGGDFF